MKTIGITGGTGFVGSALARLLISKGYDVVIFTRNKTGQGNEPHTTYTHWDAVAGISDDRILAQLNAVVNLAGTGIADKRWTERRKKEILDSRVKGTDFLVTKLKEHAPLCKTFISASASGFYGPDRAGSLPFAETSPAADDFLGNTCAQWEYAAKKAGEFARLIILRFGIALGSESGAFPKFGQPLSFGIMPILGSGAQVISWIAVSDLARLILFAIENEALSGIYNAVTPNPVTNRQLMKTIAAVKGGIKIPVPVPSVFLKILFGELSGEVLKSCTMSAKKILAAGFTFNHPGIASTVKAILGKE